jgi:hypothetical protein
MMHVSLALLAKVLLVRGRFAQLYSKAINLPEGFLSKMILQIKHEKNPKTKSIPDLVYASHVVCASM